MSKDDDERLDTLLSQGGLSGPEKDSVWKRLENEVPLKAVAPTRGAFSWFPTLVTAGVAFAFFAVVLMDRADVFSPRGLPALVINTECTPGCESFTVLVPSAPRGEVTIFAERGEDRTSLVSKGASDGRGYVTPSRYSLPPGHYVIFVRVGEAHGSSALHVEGKP